MRIVVALWIIVTSGMAAAQEVEPLRAPGVVALMRHALAPGTGDPARFDLRDCTTQRNLDARGRAQARRTGEVLRATGIEFDAVWTSQWCRAHETAQLLQMGEPQEQEALNSFFGGRGFGAAQTAATRALIASLAPDARLLIVTHQVNITALTGRSVGSGEIIVTRRGPDGLEPVGSYSIAP